MGIVKDLQGQRFGRLVAIKAVGLDSSRNVVTWGFLGARGRNRTDDLPLTRRLLWPTELHGRDRGQTGRWHLHRQLTAGGQMVGEGRRALQRWAEDRRSVAAGSWPWARTGRPSRISMVLRSAAWDPATVVIGPAWAVGAMRRLGTG